MVANLRCVKLRNVVTLMRVCDAFEISPDQRATVEALLGRAIAQIDAKRSNLSDEEADKLIMLDAE